MKTVPPRIYVLLSETNQAVVFCRKTAKQVAVFGWDLKTDRFKLGQWLKGSIHNDRSDISPDGKHLIYFATRNGRTWTAVSKVPYFKGLDVYLEKDSWGGGGLFLSNDSYWLTSGVFPKEDVKFKTSVFKVENELPSAYSSSIPENVRLVRRGWIAVDSQADNQPAYFPAIYKKSFNKQWQLYKYFH